MKLSKPYRKLRRRFASWARNGARLVVDPQFRYQQREKLRLQRLPRYEPGETLLLGKPLRFADAASLLSSYKSIFEQEIYAFRPESSPVILDCGANIGLAILYWKRLFPESVIWGFEPDRDIYELLCWNCDAHDIKDVTLIDKAVWSQETTIQFKKEGADAGHIVNKEEHTTEPLITIETVRLRDYLDQRIDLLKLDIEGAEVEVLLDCEQYLDSVNHLFVEFHSYIGRRQQLDEILRILSRVGFRYHLQPEYVARQPFIQRLNSAGMDQRLNIFAYRV